MAIQETIGRLTLAGLRIMYGILWIQQARWKVPPDFGRSSNGGLWYWVHEAIKYPTLGAHQAFLQQVVVPNFILFGWLTLFTELFIGTTHLLGGLTRLGALVGLAMSINVTLSVFRVPNEWPWTYAMLIGYSILFLTQRAGHTLGIDGLLIHWLQRWPQGWARAIGRWL